MDGPDDIVTREVSNHRRLGLGRGMLVCVVSLIAAVALIRTTDWVSAGQLPATDRPTASGDDPEGRAPSTGAAATKQSADRSQDDAGPDTEGAPPERQEVRPGALSMAALDRWPQPRAVVVVTGRQSGYFEPCGCTGLENQKGGLMRRATLLRQLSERGWPVVPLDLGNQVSRIGKQSEIKFQMTVEALRELDYRAVGFGPDDLRLSSGELVAAAVNDPELFVSSNVNLLDLVPSTRVIELNGLKIGVTSVIGADMARQVNQPSIEFRDPIESLRRAAAELRQGQCDLLLLLAYADGAETERLVRAVPEFDLVISAAGAGEPTLRPEKVEGTSSQVIQVGAKGMYAGVIGIFDGQFRYQRVTLDATFEDDPRMLEALAGYQQQLEAIGLEGLGLRPTPHPSGETFVGSQQCGECHTKAHAIWEQTPHFKATEDLVHPYERAQVPRHFDPECLSCHSTGWNPQGYYPYASGFTGLKATAHLTGNGCENCHGPGSTHVAIELGDRDAADAERMQWRQRMRLTMEVAERRCLECHDLDNSPDFHKPGAFEQYWERIRHEGTD